jgi:aspartyl-tRNA(Asn)/glutamyl-tRNA(Gln) amidotransferase subunit A
LGCQVEEVETVLDEDPIDIWNTDLHYAISTRFAPMLADKEKRALLDPAVAEALDRALTRSLGDYFDALFKRYAVRDKLRRFFETYDLLLTPTAPVAPFDVSLDVPPHSATSDIIGWAYYTYAFNLTGQPAASVPAGLSAGGLPIGLQVVARTNREIDIFRAAAAFEAVQPWVQHIPKEPRAHA